MLSKVNIKGLSMLQAILLDITELKEANQLIKHKLEIEKLISSISSRFISNDDIDDAIDRSLIDMGKLIGAKRAYLLLNSEDRTVEFYSQVSCSEKQSYNKIEPVYLKIDDFPYLLKEYEKLGFIYIKNVSDLPEEESLTKNQLEKLQIESLLLFPIKIHELLLGFIGFDDIEESTHWRTDDFTLLKTSSEIIGNALERKWGEETLKNTNQLLTAILCSLTECIILIDKDYNIIWVNNETQNLLNSHFAGKKCYEFLMNSKIPCKSCIARKTFSDGKIHENEYVIKNGVNKSLRYWATTNMASKDKNDDIELVILILRIINDLT
jgi:PAS domain-containing protein